MERKACFIVLILCIIIPLKMCAEGDGAQPNESSQNVNKPTTPSETDKHGTDSSDKSKNPDADVKCENASNCKNVNASSNTDTSSFYHRLVENKGMLMRTFYVLLGVTSIVVIYFGVRAWRMRRRGSKSRKYGLIATRGADLEMEPLDGNDDDDDMTVFEVNGRQR